MPKCGNSSVGRASASQAEGRGFEARLPLSDLFLCALGDNKNCDTTHKLPEENAVDSKNNCAGTQVKTELPLEQQGIPEGEKTNNNTGSDERTKMGARTSENIKKDSVNASIESVSSGGRTPVEGAPPIKFIE